MPGLSSFQHTLRGINESPDVLGRQLIKRLAISPQLDFDVLRDIGVCEVGIETQLPLSYHFTGLDSSGIHGSCYFVSEEEVSICIPGSLLRDLWSLIEQYGLNFSLLVVTDSEADGCGSSAIVNGECEGGLSWLREHRHGCARQGWIWYQ